MQVQFLVLAVLVVVEMGQVLQLLEEVDCLELVLVVVVEQISHMLLVPVVQES